MRSPAPACAVGWGEILAANVPIASYFSPACRNHFIIFSGGMPRASYGDRHCVSILQGQSLVTLDFTSRVIDFFTVHHTEPEEGRRPALRNRARLGLPPQPDISLLCLLEFDNPSALVVLVEEELVVLDLQTPGWPTVPAPYLAPLHSSAITCAYHISNVPLKLWERIIGAGEQQGPRHPSGVGERPLLEKSH